MYLINVSVCPHPSGRTTTCADIQLKPLLFNFPVTIFRAWYFISDVDHLPGWIIIGVTFPNSEVIGLVFIFWSCYTFLSFTDNSLP